MQDSPEGCSSPTHSCTDVAPVVARFAHFFMHGMPCVDMRALRGGVDRGEGTYGEVSALRISSPPLLQRCSLDACSVMCSPSPTCCAVHTLGPTCSL